MTPQERKAMELALEALEKHKAYGTTYPADHEAITDIKEALAQPEQEQEPVAYLVIGPYEKTAFSDIGSANEYCRELNKGFGTDAYIVSFLYTTPPQRTWVGLTIEDKEEYLAQDFGGNRLDAMDWAARRLKEKNA